MLQTILISYIFFQSGNLTTIFRTSSFLNIKLFLLKNGMSNGIDFILLNTKNLYIMYSLSARANGQSFIEW